VGRKQIRNTTRGRPCSARRDDQRGDVLGTGLDNFSDVSDVPSLTLIPSDQYYTQFPTASFDLPSDISAALDAFYRLDAGPRERFLRAAYWVNHAGSVSSDSASFVALVQAIEAAMPSQSSEECPTCGKPKGDGPTAAFQKFVDKFSRGLTEKERKEFYGARSSLTHGRHLHHWDADGFSFSPTASAEQANHRRLFRVVRIVLLNWLWHQQDPASSSMPKSQREPAASRRKA
jgi:hypothetical protein